ncbi:DNA-methyltransferase [Alicyclobacillus acidoterrestris]|uniref:Methyltransferase n=1 Tax=Alicyclobacillus acidoterrestris (strain ATCC 49025 / DSM 3922 / CIP 106132 / NCIMB 13137 / GD3B) TaxID=1356854 RepID=A0A9E6ZHP9_ALIAG|nr:site-specific DNA-methyltransferase [Alicyclobacillus acidoterrestris]UNO50910.1 site-specific DNA-methyltransferase [Alicyclobacillus acidoterrestris]
MLGGVMLNRIYQIPCEDGLKLLPDESVDLVIADPPYGIKFRSNIRKVRFDAIDNDDTFNFDWIDEAYRVLKVGGAIYCYTRWDVYPQWFDKITDKFKVKNTIVWYKKGGGLGDLRGAYMFNHEFIIYGVKGRHVLNGKRTNDVWEIQKDSVNSYEHPTQKPLALSQRIIEKSSNEGDIVLIPFCGSGSECVSATTLKRNFVSFETNPQYIEIANKRLDNIEEAT